MAASDAGSVSSCIPEGENCSEIRLLLSALVDNETTPEEETRAKAHITICVDCASHLAFLRLTSRAFSQMPEALPSASLSARIAAATYDRPTLSERIAGWLRPAPVRVGLGAALAAGLAMVFIVPRMGEVNTADVPNSLPENAGGLPKVKSESKPVAKSTERGVSTPQKSSAKSVDTPAAAVPKPNAVAAVKAPAAKTAVVTAPLSALPAKRNVPLVTASVSRRQPTLSVQTGRAAMSANEVLRNARTEPQMDRGRPKRALSSMPMERPGAESVTLNRNGFDRAAATEQILKTREAVASAASAASPVSAAGNSGISPMLSDSNAGKLAESNGAPSERTAPRSASETTVATGGPIRIRINGGRARDAAVVALPEVSQRGTPSLSANDAYSFAAGNAAHIGIASAPVK